MSNNIKDAKRISDQVSIKHCNICLGYTEYYCHDCEANLCRPCKEMHVDILNIKYHNVTVYKGKCNTFPIREMCTKHPDQVIESYCKTCDFPVCFHCRKHRQHKREEIRAVHENKLMHCKNIYINIRCETLYNSQFLLNDIKSDLTTCHIKIDKLKSAMLSVSERLNDFMDNVQSEISLIYKAFLVRRVLMQKIKLVRKIARIQKYDLSTKRPVQVLRFIKTTYHQIKNELELSQECRISLNPKINMDGLIKLLSEIKSGKQHQEGKRNELPLTLMPCPVLQKSLSLTDVQGCFHISRVTPHRMWLSDVINTLALIDTAKGGTLYNVGDLKGYDIGNHSVNSERELIYIGNHSNINKLSDDMKTNTLLIDNTDPAWTPLCVYCSPFSGDLLVGMHNKTITYTRRGKVMRYDKAYKNTQIIPHNNTPVNLYIYPRCITENNNGDVVVSDRGCRAVLGTSREGIHRFSYAGPPSGSGIRPQGICTDALSHILVCDLESRAVHMLNQDGEFLKYLLTDQLSAIDDFFPYSLSYDLYNHCLWVGSKSNWAVGQLSVYRHINKHPAILGKSDFSDNYMQDYASLLRYL